MNKLIKIVLIFQLFFLAGAANSATNDILLGPGDILKISVFEQPDLALEVRVSESGTITYPLIGEVSVGGETPAAAEKKIASKLEAGGFLRNPHVSIIVSQLQSLQVSVLGQVNRPGRYPLEGQRTLADVLALASGIAPEGGELITLIRTRENETTREVIDLAEMMRVGDVARNITITGGDILYVERAQRFYIYGEVQRPSQYRLEYKMTVLQALAIGGGLTLRGTERGVKIKRRDSNGVVQIIKAKHDDLIQADDVVYVQESLF
ncbi:polysaccharide export protein EpsE [Methylobacillus caricis]|uniref:polysaccharide export protein EpsE n=1 Tax=Methylobacillus caricis TaxID=1971611 RepID=UPI001CFFDC15|nr:polysaccharide export protein EpsE [Methylobacillus caricis]MCB5188085.1 polysaccharide export protein EpsE [Methylobacillus caricis]